MSELALPTKVRTRACFMQLLGAWAIEPDFLESGISQVSAIGIENIWARNEKLGEYPMFSPSVYHIAEALGIDLQAREKLAATQAASKPSGSDQVLEGPPPYINYRGTAIVPVSGPLSKMPTSLGHMFGGSSTVGMRKALALALADASVARVMLHIDSPGGTVAGTGDLGDELFNAQSIKPTASFVEDLGASAAYWLASQTGMVYASPHAQVGSIGVIRVVHDSSKAAEAQGVKVHVIKTGPYKGGPVPGAPVTPDALKHMQSEVDAFHNVFVQSIARGRNLPESQVSALADGRVFLAPEALRNGLVDAVGSFAAALSDFVVQHTDMQARAAKTKPTDAADSDEQAGLKRRKGWKGGYTATSGGGGGGGASSGASYGTVFSGGGLSVGGSGGLSVGGSGGLSVGGSGGSAPGDSVVVTFGEPKLSSDGTLTVISRNYADSTGLPLAEALAEAGVDDAGQETNVPLSAAPSDLAAASEEKGNSSNTAQDHVDSGDASMADPPTNPAGKSAAEPVTLSAAAHEALLRKADEGSQALRLVQELKEAHATSAKASLDSERERIMANYGTPKEDVLACADIASLRALENAERRAGTKRTAASPDKQPADAAAARVAHFESMDKEREAFLSSIAIKRA